MKASLLISHLARAGWQQIRQQGIHYILMHPHHPTLISIPDLGEQALKPSLVNDIFREAGLKARVFRFQVSPHGIVTMVKKLMGFTSINGKSDS